MTLSDKEEWLRKLKLKYPYVLQIPFSYSWKPQEVFSDGYVPIKEHGSKYYLFKTSAGQRRAQNIMDGNE